MLRLVSIILLCLFSPSLYANSALQSLRNGNAFFAKGISEDKAIVYEASSHLMAPKVVVLTNTDLPLPPNMIFQQRPGYLLSVQTPLATLSEDVIAGLDASVSQSKARLLVVLADYRGKMLQAACQKSSSELQQTLFRKLQPAFVLAKKSVKKPACTNNKYLQQVMKEHVSRVVRQIYERSSAVKTAVDNKKLLLVGALYRRHSGRVSFLAPFKSA